MRRGFLSFRVSRLQRAALLAMPVLVAWASPAARAQAAPTLSLQASVPADDEVRLASVGYRLASANSASCRHPLMLTGMILHDIAAYDDAERAVVRRKFGLTYGFGVRKIVPGSVADEAGIERGDEIVAVNGTGLAGFAKGLVGSRATYDRTERFVDYLDGALRKGPASLTIRRGGARLTVQLAGAPGCGGRFVLMRKDELNAWSDGHYVAVTTRMMEFARDDQQLAFVVAHEMAHNILHHAERLKSVSMLLAQFGLGSRKVKKTEIEADTLAIDLMARAGFDLAAPERLLRRARVYFPFDLAITHPGISRRIGIVDAEIARIEAHRHAARPAMLAVPSELAPLDASPSVPPAVFDPAPIVAPAVTGVRLADASLASGARAPMRLAVEADRTVWPFPPVRFRLTTIDRFASLHTIGSAAGPSISVADPARTGLLDRAEAKSRPQCDVLQGSPEAWRALASDESARLTPPDFAI